MNDASSCSSHSQKNSSGRQESIHSIPRARCYGVASSMTVNRGMKSIFAYCSSDYCVAWPCAFPAVTLHQNIDQIVVWLETHCWNLMRCRFFYVIPFGLICQQIKSSLSSTVLLAGLDYSFVHPGTKEVLEQPRSSSPLKTLQNDWLDGMKHIRYRVRQHSHHYRQRFVLFWKSAQSNKSGSSPSRFLNGDAGWTWHVRASLWIPQTDRPLKMVLRYGTVAFPAFVNHFD